MESLHEGPEKNHPKGVPLKRHTLLSSESVRPILRVPPNSTKKSSSFRVGTRRFDRVVAFQIHSQKGEGEALWMPREQQAYTSRNFPLDVKYNKIGGNT